MKARATFLSGQRVYIPESGRLPAGLWMHAACRPAAVAANNVFGHLAKLSVRLAPSRKADFEPWIPHDIWLQVAAALGLSKRHLVAFRPTDARRARMLLLILNKHQVPVSFAKISKQPPNPLADLFLSRLQGHPRFLVPKVREVMQFDGWWASTEDPLPQVSHRPSRLTPPQRFELCSEISGSVPEQATNSDALIHGDFGPWNIREFAGTGLTILDWDDACRAPRASDALWHAISFRLARKESHETIFGIGVNELSPFYSASDLARAASFWLSRWKDSDSREVVAGVPKSKKLLSLETRRNLILEQFAGLY